MSNKAEPENANDSGNSGNSEGRTHPHRHVTAGQRAHVDVKRAHSHNHGLRQSQSQSQAKSESHSHSGQVGGGHDFDLPVMPAAVDVFDTTLRDGSQQEGLSLTVDDKLRVAEQLDYLGVSFIEGGWPGANPKDEIGRASCRERVSPRV